MNKLTLWRRAGVWLDIGFFNNELLDNEVYLHIFYGKTSKFSRNVRWGDKDSFYEYWRETKIEDLTQSEKYRIIKTILKES